MKWRRQAKRNIKGGSRKLEESCRSSNCNGSSLAYQSGQAGVAGGSGVGKRLSEEMAGESAAVAAARDAQHQCAGWLALNRLAESVGVTAGYCVGV